jgi:hypothetical protein
MNTNFQAAFDLILSVAKKYHLSQASLPKTMVVLSDMRQWNVAMMEDDSRSKVLGPH